MMSAEWFENLIVFALLLTVIVLASKAGWSLLKIQHALICSWTPCKWGQVAYWIAIVALWCAVGIPVLSRFFRWFVSIV